MKNRIVRCKKAMNFLKKVLAQSNKPHQHSLSFALEQKVKDAGFDSLEEAKRHANGYYSILKGDLSEEYRLAGPLARSNKWWAEIARQLPSGEVRIEFPGKKTLGRLRALIRIVAFEKGYVPKFHRGRFVREYLSPVERDTSKPVYKVRVIQMKPKARLFLGLSDRLKEEIHEHTIDTNSVD